MTHPERIGRYQVVGYLAAGGMAEILLLGRLVGPGGFERPVVASRGRASSATCSSTRRASSTRMWCTSSSIFAFELPAA